MKLIQNLFTHLNAIERALGYEFKDPQLLILSFIHRSFINEHRSVTEHNERLEFLGDSVLGLLIAEYLYVRLPHLPEGELSYLRSRLVEAPACSTYIGKLNVGHYLLLGRGEQMNDGRGRESILADLFEALIGALFLDGGIEVAKEFFFSHFQEEVDSIILKPIRNWKALLQDYCQKKYQQTPIYNVLSEEGPDHNKIFKIAVLIHGTTMGIGEGASKKEAQQAAAADALQKIPESLYGD